MRVIDLKRISFLNTHSIPMPIPMEIGRAINIHQYCSPIFLINGMLLKISLIPGKPKILNRTTKTRIAIPLDR